MIEDILKIHRNTTRNQKNREEDCEKLRDGTLTVDEFFDKWYDSFDGVGQCQLLLKKATRMLDVSVCATHFVTKLRNNNNTPQQVNRDLKRSVPVNRERPVIPRASRRADMVASVPLEVSRAISADGTISTISSAISTSAAVGAPNEVPLTAVFMMASRISG